MKEVLFKSHNNPSENSKTHRLKKYVRSHITPPIKKNSVNYVDANEMLHSTEPVNTHCTVTSLTQTDVAHNKIFSSLHCRHSVLSSDPKPVRLRLLNSPLTSIVRTKRLRGMP